MVLRETLDMSKEQILKNVNKQLTEVFSSVSTKNPPDLVGSFSFRFLHSFSLTGFLLFFAVLVLVDVVVGVDTGEVNNGGENSEELLDEGGEEVG